MITVIAALWLFYVFYVFTMGVYRVQLAGKLTGLSKVLLMPFVVVAVLMMRLVLMGLVVLVALV